MTFPESAESIDLSDFYIIRN